jgi:hypothetical protein
MLLPLVAALSLAGASVQDAPRMRTLLPNGATILVERMPEATTLSVQLFARADIDGPATVGWRHLLEHLIVKGRGGTLPQRVEAQGIFMTARTYRDSTQIEVYAAPHQLDEALAAVRETLLPLRISEEELQREKQIIEEEIALLTDAQRLSIAAWQAGWGERAGDPVGTAEGIAEVTTDELRGLQNVHFEPPRLVLAIAGPVGLDAATRAARAILEDLPRQDHNFPDFGPGKPGRVQTEEAYGEARGALVEGWSKPQTAWCLAAALAIASEFDSAFVTYTPSDLPGLVLVGRTDFNAGIGLMIDDLPDGDAARLFEVGKILARRWLTRHYESPSGVAFLRGKLMLQGTRPEVLEEHIERMSWQDFLQGLSRFRRENAAIAVGTRR